MRVRVASLNLMSGGVGRADPIAEVLLAQESDVLALSQAVDDDVFNRLRNRLSMHAVRFGGVALLSRGPIAACVDFNALRRVERPLVVAQLAGELGSLRFIVRQCLDGSQMRSDFETLTAMREKSTPQIVLGTSPPWPPPYVSTGTAGLVYADPPRASESIELFGPVKFITHRIETDRLALYASDHLPAVAEIEVEP